MEEGGDNKGRRGGTGQRIKSGQEEGYLLALVTEEEAEGPWLLTAGSAVQGGVACLILSLRNEGCTNLEDASKIVEASVTPADFGGRGG